MSCERQGTFHHVRRQVQDAWPGLAAWEVHVARGDVRVGDAERDDAARALGDHYAAGRLDRAEYDERVDLALAARTRGELSRLFRDLPALRPAARPPVRPRRASGPRLPFLPVLLLLTGLALLLHAPWVLLVGLGGFLLVRRAARGAVARRVRSAGPPYPMR